MTQEQWQYFLSHLITVSGSTYSINTTSSGGGGGAVTIVNGGDIAEGSTTDAAVTDPTAAGSVVALLKGILSKTPTTANFVSGATSDITTTAATTVVAGPGAATYLYITHILVTNSHATVGTFVNVTEETSGTVLYTGYAAPAGGGFSVTLPTPLKVPTATKALQVTCVTSGANVRASASGYKGS